MAPCDPQKALGDASRPREPKGRKRFLCGAGSGAGMNGIQLIIRARKFTRFGISFGWLGSVRLTWILLTSEAFEGFWRLPRYPENWSRFASPFGLPERGVKNEFHLRQDLRIRRRTKSDDKSTQSVIQSASQSVSWVQSSPVQSSPTEPSRGRALGSSLGWGKDEKSMRFQWKIFHHVQYQTCRETPAGDRQLDSDGQRQKLIRSQCNLATGKRRIENWWSIRGVERKSSDKLTWESESWTLNVKAMRMRFWGEICLRESDSVAVRGKKLICYSVENVLQMIQKHSRSQFEWHSRWRLVEFASKPRLLSTLYIRQSSGPLERLWTGRAKRNPRDQRIVTFCFLRIGWPQLKVESFECRVSFFSDLPPSTAVRNEQNRSRLCSLQLGPNSGLSIVSHRRSFDLMDFSRCLSVRKRILLKASRFLHLEQILSQSERSNRTHLRPLNACTAISRCVTHSHCDPTRRNAMRRQFLLNGLNYKSTTPTDSRPAELSWGLGRKLTRILPLGIGRKWMQIIAWLSSSRWYSASR